METIEIPGFCEITWGSMAMGRLSSCCGTDGHGGKYMGASGNADGDKS